MPPELIGAPGSGDLPELSGPADLETRLAEAAARARATRAVGGSLSPRAARDLRARLLEAASAAPAPQEPVAPPEADPEPAGPDVAPVPASGARRAAVRIERRRWAREAEPALEAVPAPVAVPVTVTPAPSRPRTSRGRVWRTLVRLVALLVVVAILVGATAFASGRLMPPDTLAATVVAASGATATRLGEPMVLAPGTALQGGDTVTVSSQGSAVLGLGDSRVRLAGGSAVHLDRVDAAGVSVAQLAGRAYYRDVSAAHVPFVVTTGPVTWTATGTAFDSDREPVAAGQGSGQERVTLLAIQDGVTASGPGFDTSVPQGDRAVVYIGAATPTAAPALDAVPDSALADPWVQANGAADLAAGYPLGLLDGHLQVALASPTASPSPTPFETPSLEPTETPSPTAFETPTPTPALGPTPVPTPRVTPGPTPSPTPGIGALSLTATACPGGVVLDWSTYSGKGAFKRYVTLRSPYPADPAPPVAYPPSQAYIAERVATTTRSALSGYDTDGAASQFTFRTLALTSTGVVLAASPAATAGGSGGVAPIDLTVTPNHYFAVDFAWLPFGGLSGCFSQYEVRYATTSAGAQSGSIAATDSNQGTSGVDRIAIPAGTYYFILIVRRFTALGGSLVVAESAPVPYTVP